MSFFPHDDRILITRDQAGNELNHLYMRMTGGEERDLTPGQKLKASFMGWSPDGNAFYVQTNERDPKAFDVYRYDAKTYDRALFFENKEAYFPSEVSGDGKWVSLSKMLAALAFQPEEFVAGVDLFGVANWIRTLESIPSWWAAQRVALYAELGDPSRIGRCSRRFRRCCTRVSSASRSWCCKVQTIPVC